MSFLLKRLVFFILVCVIFFGILSCGKKRKGVVARVNKDILTEEDVERVFSQYDSVNIEQKKDYVSRWIDNELIYQEAKRRKIDQNQGLKRDIRDMTKDLVVVNFLQKEFGEKIFATEEEAKEFYQKQKEKFRRETEEVCASQILLAKKDDADSAFKRIKKGEPFSKVARGMSIDFETREKGGDMGCFDRLSVHPQIAEQAFSHKIGNVTKPFQTEWGWHILLIKDKKKKGTEREFELVKAQILSYLNDQKRKERIAFFVEELKKKAKIERYGWAGSFEEIKDTSQKE